MHFIRKEQKFKAQMFHFKTLKRRNKIVMEINSFKYSLNKAKAFFI